MIAYIPCDQQVIAQDTIGPGKKSGGAPQRRGEEHPIMSGNRLAPGSQHRGDQSSSPSRRGPGVSPDLQRPSTQAEGLAGEALEKGKSNTLYLSCLLLPSVSALDWPSKIRRATWLHVLARTNDPVYKVFWVL